MKQRKKSFGMRISAFVLSFAMVCTLLAGVNVVAFAADDNDLIVSVHSFYNDADKGGDGEHLFTKDADEMSWLSSLPTWNDEGESWKAPVSSSLAVYRVYNPNSGEHHYAAADEASWLVSQGWTQEKIAFYSDDNMGVPVYRLWNGLDGVGSHYYTTDEGEASWLASIGWTAEGVNFYGVKEEEPGEKVMEAEQTGADEIMVTSNTKFTGLEEFAVSHGVVEDAVVSCEFIADNIAVLTLDSNIVEAAYTVECSDEEYEATGFIGEEAEITQVIFPTDELVLAPTGIGGATVYVFTDQWGDPMNDPDASFTVAPTYAAAPDWNDETEIGTLTIASATSPATVIVEGTKIPVSVVYANNTKVENVVLTASAASYVNDIEVGEIVPLDEDLEGLRITNERMYAANSAAAVYALPINAKDQYGLELDADALNTMVGAQQLFVTPLSGIAKVGNFKDVDGQTYLPVYYDDATFASYGAETINFLSRSGFSTVGGFVVYPMEVIDAIDVNVGDLQVGKAVPFAFLATDQYGDLVDYTDTDLYQVAPAATSSTITVTRKINGNAVGPVATITATYGSVFTLTADGFTLTASAQAGTTKQETLNVKTATNKISLPTAKVNAQATPAYVKEFADDAVLSYANTAATIQAVTSAATYVIIDSYGQEMSADDFNAGGYTLEVAPGSTKFTTYTQGAIQLVDALATSAPTSPVTETYKVTIKDGTGATVSTKNVNVTVAGKIAQYAATFVATDLETPKATFYVGNQMNAGSEAAILVLIGIDNKGNMINVPLDGFDINYDTQVGASTMSCIVANGVGTVITNAADTGATLVVKENTFKIYKDGSLVTTATLECSNEAPEAIMVIGIKDPAGTKTAVDLETGFAAQSGAAIAFTTSPLANGKKVVSVGAGTAQVVIFALDQYGNYINIDDADIGGIQVPANGTIPASFSGKTVTLEIEAGDIIEDIDVYVAAQ